MKTFIASFGLALLICAANVGFAQGTLRLWATLTGPQHVPPSDTPLTASGSFDLAGHELEAAVHTFHNIPISGGIYGPADPTTVGPLIYSFSAPVVGCSPDVGCLYGYGERVSLSDSQVGDFLAERLYVEVSFGAGQSIRGQIMFVPEPSAWLVFLLGLCALVFGVLRRRPGRSS